MKKELEAAEEKLNQYQITAETIDITAEGEAILEQVVELEKQISQLEIQRAEIEQRFQPSPPVQSLGRTDGRASAAPARNG